MKPIIKFILIALVTVAVLASVAANVYIFGWQYLQNSLMQKGYNIAVSQVIQTVQQQGWVQVGSYKLIVDPQTAAQEFASPTPAPSQESVSEPETQE
jgi:hypothetical protein